MRLPISSIRQNKPKGPGWPLMLRRVQGHSMMPVLPPGTNTLGLRWYRQLRVGDIVIFFHDGKEKIKRIAEIENNKLYVLGDHSHASSDSRQYGWIDRSQVIARVIWPGAKKVEAELGKNKEGRN